MKKKQILAIIMIVGVLCSFMSINVSARSSMEITPYRWSNISVVVCTVGFQGTTGTVLCNIIGKAGATAVRGTLVLYEGATEKKSWDLASSTGSVYVLEGFTGISGVTYKLTLDAEVYKDGYWEPVSREESTKCP